MLSTPQDFPIESNQMKFHDMSREEEYSSEQVGKVEDISSDGVTKISNQRHIVKKFQVQITSKIVNSIKSHAVRPLTGHLVNMSVESFTSGMEKSLEEERKTHRSTCKNDCNESDLSKSKTSTSFSSLKPVVGEAIQSIEKGEAQGSSTAAAAAKALNRKIQIFDKKGRLVKTLGDGPGEPLKVKYTAPKTGSDTGHYEPLDGSQVAQTGGKTCLLDTLASMSGTSTNDLKQEVISVIKSNPTVSNRLYENKQILQVRNAAKLYKGGNVEDMDSEIYNQMMQGTADPKTLLQNVDESDKETWNPEKVEKFLLKVARAAERNNPGDGFHKGREKHNKIHKVVEDNREDLCIPDDLKFEESFNRKGERGRLDVRDIINKVIYDWKFGKTAATDGQTGMGKDQFKKYHTAYPNYDIKTINKKSEIKDVTKETFKR